MNHYLENSHYIDWQHPAVLAKALELSGNEMDKVNIVRSCFEFVRDEIPHSWDFRQGPVTCAASTVLAHGTGYCYAKSHLLAALLRANGIPAGLCYQRLSLENNGEPYCLHGLNAAWLPELRGAIDLRINGAYKGDANEMIYPEGRESRLAIAGIPIVHAVARGETCLKRALPKAIGKHWPGSSRRHWFMATSR
jgi:transglutaminase-like putative cysteine protease